MLAAALALACVLGVGACAGPQGGLQEGELVPDFVLPTLAGKVQKLSNYRGQVVMVNLWATWCPPCIEEMPLLERIQKEYEARGLVVLGLAGDDDPERVRAFVAQHPLSFEVLLDVGGEVGTRYGITGYPETFVVDREGRLRRKIVGPLPNDAGRLTSELSAALEALLG